MVSSPMPGAAASHVAIRELMKHYRFLDIQRATRDDILGIFRQIIEFRNSHELDELPTFPASLSAAVQATAAPRSFSVPLSGPIIRESKSIEVPLSLWPAVLPWETSHGLSLVPADVIGGTHGKRASSTSTGDTSASADDDVDDPLALVSNAMAPDALKTGAASPPSTTRGTTTTNEASPLSSRSLRHANGMLFVHRGDYTPTYWSGGIASSIDVGFFTCPNSTSVLEELSLRPRYKGPHDSRRRTRNQFHGHTMLAEPLPGYGPLDDPGPYSHFLNSASQEEMKLVAHTLGSLDAFPTIKEYVDHHVPFCGDHRAGVTPHMERMGADGHDGFSFRTSPSVNRTTRYVTSILEVRRHLFSDLVQAMGLTPAAAARADASLTLSLSHPLMQELEASEFFYREMIMPLQERAADLLELCHTVRAEDKTRQKFSAGCKSSSNSDQYPQYAEAERTQQESHDHDYNDDDAAASLDSPPKEMRLWGEGTSDGDSRADLTAGAPRSTPSSYHGTDGGFSQSKRRSESYYCDSDPRMMVAYPVDVPLFAAAYELSLADRAYPRLMPRLFDDVCRGNVSGENCDVLRRLVENPKLQMYPPELISAIHRASARQQSNFANKVG